MSGSFNESTPVAELEKGSYARWSNLDNLGNYIAALKPAIIASQTQKTFMFIADLHALNSIHDAKTICEHTYQAAALLIS